MQNRFTHDCVDTPQEKPNQKKKKIDILCNGNIVQQHKTKKTSNSSAKRLAKIHKCKHFTLIPSEKV